MNIFGVLRSVKLKLDIFGVKKFRICNCECWCLGGGEYLVEVNRYLSIDFEGLVFFCENIYGG